MNYMSSQRILFLAKSRCFMLQSSSSGIR